VKIALASQGAGWVIDDIVKDYKKYTSHKIVGMKDDPDLIWCVNLWSFHKVHESRPMCPVVLSVHHIDETKIDEYPFEIFNKAHTILVPNKITEDIASKYFKKPVERMPYWVLSKTFEPKSLESVIKHRFCGKAGANDLVIGSFQRDTQRNGTPKLSKGPDLLLEVITKLHQRTPIFVMLAGWNRKYLVNAIKKLGVPYDLVEHHPNINELYDCIDWYLVTSRTEGGPQAVLEAPYRSTRILSTPVGIAPEILHPDCICPTSDDFVKAILEDVDQRKYNHDMITGHHMPEVVIPKLDEFFRGIK